MDNAKAQITSIFKQLGDIFETVEQARGDVAQKPGDINAAMRYLEAVSGVSPKHLKAFIVQHPEYVVLLQDPNASPVTTIIDMASKLWQLILADEALQRVFELVPEGKV